MPESSPSRGRRIARRVIVVGVLVAQLTMIVLAYDSDHKTFGFQMFPESSRWSAEIVRVQADGTRIPIDEDWEYRWAELVRGRGLTYPSAEHHADSGLRNQLGYLRGALDWVAEGTPEDADTWYLEAEVTYYDNGRGPFTRTFRSVRDGVDPVTTVGARLAQWNDALDARGDIRAMAVLRILLGPIVLLHLEDTLRDAANGIIYADHFTLPYATWYPEASRVIYEPMLWLAAVTAVAMSFGFLTRVTTAYTAFFVGYHLFLSKTHYAHNRAFLLILLVTIAILPVGRHFSVDAWIGRRRGRGGGVANTPLWPVWLVRLEVVGVYCASATSKVIDQDWWSGRVLRLRAVDGRRAAIDDGAPSWLMDVLADGTFQWWFSKSAVLTEFVIGLGFLHRRTRLFAIWIAIPFHLAIQIGARVQVFSWAALAALVIWVTPETRTRQLIVPVGHRLGPIVRVLDWFGRFEVEQSGSSGVTLVEHVDGVVATRVDRAAVWTTLSRLPATFWFAMPVLLLTRRRQVTAPPGSAECDGHANDARPVVADRHRAGSAGGG